EASGPARRAYTCVPRDSLPGFIHELDVGGLDDAIAAYLAHPCRHRVLSAHRQTGHVGLYDQMGTPAGLLAPERDPQTGHHESGRGAKRAFVRPGKRNRQEPPPPKWRFWFTRRATVIAAAAAMLAIVIIVVIVIIFVIPRAKIPQLISFTAPTSGLVGGSDTLSATGGGSGNPVKFSVDSSSDPGVCSVSGTNGATVTYAAAGSCVIDANQDGNGTYAAAPQVQKTI